VAIQARDLRANVAATVFAVHPHVQVAGLSLAQAPNQLVKIACTSGAAVSVTCVP
jgi:phosphopantothenate synthetase